VFIVVIILYHRVSIQRTKPGNEEPANEAGRDKKNVREIEFVASGQSVAGIEFYAWDFSYDNQKGFKPVVIRDTNRTQVHKFKPGLHNIAVKVVDNDGLDNIEIIKLKVNGTIERT